MGVRCFGAPCRRIRSVDMKILSREQLYRADALTMERQGISSAALMERAATLAFEWIHKRLNGSPVPLRVFCGIGNNGGDGLVMARHLQEHGYHVEVFIVDYAPNRSEDFLLNLQALKDRKVWPVTLEAGRELPELDAEGIIVDAIFGIGLSRPPEPWLCALFEKINTCGAFVLSIDLPSGMYPEPSDPPLPCTIRARHVLTFGTPKLSFFTPEAGNAAPQWTALDIGLDREYLAEVPAQFVLWGPEQAREAYRPRGKYAHKGDFGHALLVGGSLGKVGAVHLAARAALKTGAGLVSAWVPDCGLLPLQTGLPEIMVQVSAGREQLSNLPPEGGYTLGMGMGMGTGKDTVRALEEWLPGREGPMLFDADALNILSANPELLKTIPENSILTPHPGEFKRLAGPWEGDREKLEKAFGFSKEYRCVLVLKGAHTMVFHDGRAWINTSGNSGMATAGSGDVLSGMITALLAQGYSSPLAALMGVYLHGSAGDLALSETGYEALTARTLIDFIGKAFLDLFQKPGQDQGAEAGSDGSGQA